MRSLNLTIQNSLCFQCSLKKKTCCQNREIYVTPGDIKRIKDKTGIGSFFEFCISHDAQYMEQDDDPVWMNYVFRADRSRRILKRQSNGDCFFLSHQGCELTLDVRPLLCRLHPLHYNAEQIYPDPEPECPAHLLNEGQTLMQALGMTLENARIWHRTLYFEILTEKQHHENRIDL